MSSRLALPWVLGAIAAANALLWGLRGPAAARGWAINADFVVARLCTGFAFFTAPLFVALLAASSAARDDGGRVREVLDATPLRRGEYVAGKYLGVALAVTLGTIAFPAVLFALQFWPDPAQLRLPVRVAPYLFSTVLLVLVPALSVAAVSFAAGLKLRRRRHVLLAVVALLALGVLPQILAPSTTFWRVAFDPSALSWLRDAEPLIFGPALLLNRGLLLLLGAAALSLATRSRPPASSASAADPLPDLPPRPPLAAPAAPALAVPRAAHPLRTLLAFDLRLLARGPLLWGTLLGGGLLGWLLREQRGDPRLVVAGAALLLAGELTSRPGPTRLLASIAGRPTLAAAHAAAAWIAVVPLAAGLGVPAVLPLAAALAAAAAFVHTLLQRRVTAHLVLFGLAALVILAG